MDKHINQLTNYQTIIYSIFRDKLSLPLGAHIRFQNLEFQYFLRRNLVHLILYIDQGQRQPRSMSENTRHVFSR
jgi:hypothetical protein